MAKGVEIRGNVVRVYFRWEGALCREPLELEPTPANLAHAERMVASIKYEIEAGSFVYSRWFPKSRRLEENSLGAWLDLWLETKGRQVAASTMGGYRGVAERYIRPRWGAVQVLDIDTVALEGWIAGDLDRLASKTIKETIAVLHQVFRLFRSRHPGAADPTEGITVRLPDADDPDPFTRAEMESMLSHPTKREGELNLVAFMLWTGLRVSEGIALAWEDVEDLERGRVRVRRANVRGLYRVTKTRRSTRTLELLKPAREALVRQWALTGGLPPVEVEVTERDNRTLKQERLRFVFLNSNTGRAHYDDFRLRDRFFKAHLRAAGVRYRGPGQFRHTFISQMLTLGAPVEWIAHQVGHTSAEMIRRRYGKWIEQDGGDVVGLLERRLGV